ncbi:MAG: helix-hairpin-helix domain-containing protein [Solirubrobacterales bacterium]|nr:helix-hairpin-helix domain-containing protein [Solirubrobacterales bacterium]
MAELTPRRLALCAAGLVLIVALGVSQLRRGGGEPVAVSPAAATIAVQERSGGRLVIHVAGAVRRPGVYKLGPAARVADAVERAGGARGRADLGGLNLAARLEDGRQVLVPERPSAGGGAVVGSGAAAPAASAPAPGQPLNVNSATLEQLDTLSGVGPLTAQKILEFRDERGGFGSIEELGEIPGIGDVRLATLREELTL